MKLLKTFLVILGLVFFVGGLSSIARAAEEKDWTIAVFLNGDNNLDSYGTSDMKEMEMVGSSDRVNIIVLRDTANSGTSSKIYYVNKGGSQVVKDYGANIDMGDYRTLVDFFRFVKAQYPAKHFLVDIWNHGAGWKLKNAVEPVRGISYDDNSGNHITTPQLGDAFRQMMAINDGQKIDVFGMDACLMEMAEVAYEVSDSVSYMIGSEETEPGDGWAYAEALRPLVAQPSMSPEEVSVAIEREYVKSYNGGVQGKQDVQGSVVAPDRLAAAAGKLNALASYMISNPRYYNAFLQAAKETQAYAYADYKDMNHFIRLTQAKITQDAQYQALADDAVGAVSNAIVYNSIAGQKLKNSTGLSVWIPTKSIYEGKRKDYEALRWSKEVSWNSLLVALLIPSVPVVTFEGMKAFDENNDGFLMAGERVRFKVDLKNDSPVVAKNGVLKVSVPAGIEVEVGEVKVADLNQGTVTVEGLSVVVDKNTKPGSYPVTFSYQVSGLGTIEKTYALAVDGSFTVEDYKVSSVHPYASSSNVKWTISKPGVSGLRIHFAKYDTEAKYDFVTITDKAGKVLAKYDGDKGAFWTPVLPSDTVIVNLTSDSSVNRYGFDIDKIAY